MRISPQKDKPRASPGRIRDETVLGYAVFSGSSVDGRFARISRATDGGGGGLGLTLRGIGSGPREVAVRSPPVVGGPGSDGGRTVLGFGAGRPF